MVVQLVRSPWRFAFFVSSLPRALIIAGFKLSSQPPPTCLPNHPSKCTMFLVFVCMSAESEFTSHHLKVLMVELRVHKMGIDSK